MRNLANKNRVKRNIYFSLCVSMFLGSVVAFSSVSAAMLASDPDATTQENALLFYDQDAAMRARDRAIKLALSVCIPNLGHAPVICPLVQDYDDSMYAFNYGRPLTCALSLFIPSSGPRQLIKGYNGLTAEEQGEWQEKLNSAVWNHNIVDVENALNNGTCVSSSCSRLMRQILIPFFNGKFDPVRLPIARLLLAEGAKLPLVRKALVAHNHLYTGGHLQAIEFILKYSEKLDEKDLGEALIEAVENSTLPIIRLLLASGANVYTAKGPYRDWSFLDPDKNATACNYALSRFLNARNAEETQKAIGVLKEITHAGGFDSVNLDSNFINDPDNWPQIDTLVREGQREREDHIRRCVSEVYLPHIAPIIVGYAASSPVEPVIEELSCLAPDQLLLK